MVFNIMNQKIGNNFKIIICMKSKIVSLVLLFFVGTIGAFSQKRELKTEDDGFQWYFISSEKGKGAQTVTGTMIVPVDKGYEWVSYENGLFCATIFSSDGDYMKDKVGFYDKFGKELISSDKYEHAYYNSEKDNTPAWFSVYKDGCEGACDATGNQIVSPIYKSLLYGSKGFEGKRSDTDNWTVLGIVLPQHDIMAFVKKRKMEELDGFIWYKLEDYPNYGAADEDGNILIPINLQLTSVRYKSSNKQGVYGVFDVKKDNCVGVYSVKGVEILSPNKGYTSWKYKGDDERGYLQVDKGDLEYGICDLKQNEIIPPGKYSYVYYDKDGFFCVELGEYEGICNLNGDEIIPPDRYTSVIYKNTWFSVKKGELEGACDLKGKELIPPVYDFLFYDDEMGFYYSENGNNIALNVKMASSDISIVESEEMYVENASSNNHKYQANEQSSKVMSVLNMIAGVLNTTAAYMPNGNHSNNHYVTPENYSSGSSRSNMKKKSNASVISNAQNERNARRTYSGYVEQLSRMKSGLDSYSDSNRRNIQSKMRSIRLEWNLPKDVLEDWNGTK